MIDCRADLTAQVFLQALENLPKYRHQGHFAAWLFTIARRRAADYFRRPPREVPLEEDGRNEPEYSFDPLARLVRAEDLRNLAELVGQLKEDDRELLRLRFAAGLSFVEMGALLGGKESAVKMSVHRLLARLQSQLEQDHD